MGDTGADRPVLILLAAGHFAVDVCQAAVPATLPFFVADRHLSYAAAAGLVFAQTVSSSILQPLFGYLSDRRPLPLIMPLGIVVAAAGIATSAFMGQYLAIWLAILASGLGIAAYHPEGARYARYSSGARQGSGMSVFSVGGNIGFAAGPILLTPLLVLRGLEAAWLACLVPAAIAAAVLIGLPRIVRHRPSSSEGSGAVSTGGSDDWSAFGRLTGVTLARTVLFYGLNTFIPLFWVGQLHTSKAAAGVALAVLLAAGPIGTILGGRLGDRYSRRTIIIVGTALSGPLVALVVLSPTPQLSMLLLVPVALAAYAPSSLIVVLGQEYLPNRVGTAAGMTMGLSFSAGGLLAPGIGWIADRAGLVDAMLVLAAVPALGLLFALALPRRVLLTS